MPIVRIGIRKTNNDIPKHNVAVALALYLFSIVLVDYASAVPHLSSNVPFPVHEFNELFHFHAQLHNRNA
jgi:hypothetical protein